MFRFSLYLQQFNVFSRLSAIIPPIISCESKEIPHIMQANFVNASIHFAVVLPLLYNDDAKLATSSHIPQFGLYLTHFGL